MTEQRELHVTNDGIVLAGSLWLPDGDPSYAIVMHPGSGGEDRNNSGYFEPLREALLAAGYAVASFDKRGVGGSGGRWQDAPIDTQARDLLAAASEVQRQPELVGLPVGLFGHSQGAWVALEAGTMSEDPAFLILNSFSGVTPAEQERYSAEMRLLAADAPAKVMEVGLARYDLMVRLARALTPYSEISARKADLSPHVPRNASVWHFWVSILDYQPKRALGRVHAPILALYGSADRVVPVEESIAVLRSVVPPSRLTVAVFEGANHRVQVGDPRVLADGYIDTVLTFLESHSQS